MKNKCGLYLITPQNIKLPDFIDRLKEAFDAGKVEVLQLRLKDKTTDEIKKSAEIILPICRNYAVSFILNDNPELAKIIGADGVHVGIEDCSAAEARRIVGKEMIVGVSCYDSKDRAFVAGEEDANYVAFGAFYPTKTKEPRGYPKAELLKWWSTYTKIPAVAIGGITPENAKPLIEAGADYIAVVSAVWDNEKGVADAVRRFNNILRSK